MKALTAVPLFLIWLSACGKHEPPPAPSTTGPTVRGKVLAGGEPSSDVLLRAQGVVLQGNGKTRTIQAGETRSGKDGTFEIVLPRECVDAFRSRTSWGWSLEIQTEHPGCFRASVQPSHIDTWDELSKITVAFPDVSGDIAADLRAKFEEFRKNPGRTRAKVGLEPSHWGPFQELFDEIVDAIGDLRDARTLVKSFERDADPHVRALAYEALGVVHASDDDEGRPERGKALLEWCYRDVERSKHGGHYSMGVKLDDGCTRCYSRWEDAEVSILTMEPSEVKAFMAERKDLKGQVGVFHALLSGVAARSLENRKTEVEWRADFDLTTTMKAGESALVYFSYPSSRLIGPNRLDQPVTFTPDWFALEEYAWSPDGKRLAGRGGRSAGAPYEIWILDLEKGKASRATWGGGIDWRPAWFPGGDRLLFARNGAKGQELWTVDATTYEASKVDHSDDWMDHFSLHSDGKRVAVGGRQGTAYVLDLATGRKTPLGDALKLPTWSPRDDRIAVIRKDALHVGERRISPEGLRPHRLSWSPDGAWIAFTYWRESGGAGFGLIRPDGSGFRELRKDPQWPSEATPTWAADSKQVALGGSLTGAHAGDLWIFPVGTGAGFKHIDGAAGYAAWRPVK